MPPPSNPNYKFDYVKHPIEEEKKAEEFRRLSMDDMKKLVTEFILQPFPVDGKDKILPNDDPPLEIMKRGSITRRSRGESLDEIKTNDNLYIDRKGLVRFSRGPVADETSDFIDISWMPQMGLISKNLNIGTSLINPQDLHPETVTKFYTYKPYNADYRKWDPSKVPRGRELQNKIKMAMKVYKLRIDKRGRLRVGSKSTDPFQSRAVMVTMWDPIWAGWNGVDGLVFPEDYDDMYDGTNWGPEEQLKHKQRLNQHISFFGRTKEQLKKGTSDPFRIDLFDIRK